MAKLTVGKQIENIFIFCAPLFHSRVMLYALTDLPVVEAEEASSSSSTADYFSSSSRLQRLDRMKADIPPGLLISFFNIAGGSLNKVRVS